MDPAPPALASVDVQAAATVLGVGVRRVQHLVESGVLVRAARGEIEVSSLERHLLTVAGSRTRPWSEATAWGAIALVCGDDAPWVGPSQRSRLRAQLREMRVDSLVSFTRRRARVQYVAGHRAAAPVLRRHLVEPVRDRLGGAGILVDGYGSPETVAALRRSECLYPDPCGAYVLRATTFDLTVVRRLATDHHEVLAALDDAERTEGSEARSVLDRALRGARTSRASSGRVSVHRRRAASPR